MKWKIILTSDLSIEEKIHMTNIDTIQDLKRLSQMFNARLIIDFVKNEIIIDDVFIE